jgi:hypothetical protein
MSEMTLNINNLELEDNTFEVIPEGDYRFLVDSHSVGYATSDKMPPNTQQITCNLHIPVIKDGEIVVANVRNYLNIYRKALFAVRQFAECIGMTPEKGKFSVDLEKMDGMTGICHVTVAETNNGNEVNRVQMFYAPSKAPAVTSNDEAWEKWNDFQVAQEGDLDDIRKLFDAT